MYKVLFLGWEYYPVFTGGLGVVCHALAEGMAERELEVYVVLPKLADELDQKRVKFPKSLYTNKVNVKIETIFTDIALNPYQTVTNSWLEETAVGERVKAATLNANQLYGHDLFGNVERYTQAVKDLASELDFDIIHAHDWMTFKAAIAARDQSGKKAVLHVHATELDRTADNPNPYIQSIEKDMLGRADMVLAVSGYTRNLLIDRYKLSHTKVKVLHNALTRTEVPATKLALGAGKTVVFLGRVVVQKGVENFVRIARRIADILPNTNFVFAGDGPLLPQVMEMVCDLGLHENFIFTGGVSRMEGDIIYQNADLYIMTSGSEPFGLTALEAINQGTPVIVSKTAGVIEVLPNAIAVDFWDVDKYADYAVNILLDADFQQFLTMQQSHDLARLTWKQQVDTLIGIYHELLNTNKYSL